MADGKRNKTDNRPKALVVGNHVYTIRWRTMDGLYGLTTPAATLIDIDPSPAPSQVRDTLLHEALHAVIEDGVSREMGSDAAETLIRDLAPRLLHLIRNNPEFLRFLLED